jgi:membrane associated rhomboid family serine protease
MTPWVSRLVIANVIAFGLQVLLPGFGSALTFVPWLTLSRPWSVITYMFLHGGVMHLLFNMLGLYFFGPRLEERLGSRRFVTLYFVAGITGALLSTIFSPRAALIGASAGVFGVMLGFATFWPRERIYIWGIIPVEARALVIITTAFSLYAGFSGASRGVADFAHLGGYAGAWLYLLFLDRTSDRRTFARKMRAAPAPEVVRRIVRADELRLDGVHELSREEVNRILDKISARGVGSLTPQERLFLSNFVPPDDRRNWTA